MRPSSRASASKRGWTASRPSWATVEYLVGESFSVADLTAAAIYYPLVRPAEGPQLPPPTTRLRSRNTGSRLPTAPRTAGSRRCSRATASARPLRSPPSASLRGRSLEAMSGAAAPPRDSPSAAEPAAPVAFATTERQDRERLASAPLRSAPRPSLLRASADHASRRRSPARSGGGRARDRDARRPAAARSPLLPRARRAAAAGGAEAGRACDGVGRGALGAGCGRPAGAGSRSSRRPSRTHRARRKAVWFNQPWLAERLREPGRGCCCTESSTARGSGSRRTSSAEARTAPTRDLHTTGLVPVHPASERLRAQRIREWAWQARPLARHALEPLPAELRARRRLAGAADSLARRPLSEQPRRGRAGSRPARLRGALPAPGRARRRAAEAARRAARASPSASPASPSGAGWRRCPSSSRATSGGDRRDRRRPWVRAPHAAPADGGGRIAGRPVSPRTRCCARSRPASRRR